MSAKVEYPPHVRDKVVADMRAGMASFKAATSSGVPQRVALRWAAEDGVALAKRRGGRA